jgi:hypothetical protein
MHTVSRIDLSNSLLEDEIKRQEEVEKAAIVKFAALILHLINCGGKSPGDRDSLVD